MTIECTTDRGDNGLLRIHTIAKYRSAAMTVRVQMDTQMETTDRKGVSLHRMDPTTPDIQQSPQKKTGNVKAVEVFTSRRSAAAVLKRSQLNAFFRMLLRVRTRCMISEFPTSENRQIKAYAPIIIILSTSFKFSPCPSSNSSSPRVVLEWLVLFMAFSWQPRKKRDVLNFVISLLRNQSHDNYNN